MSKQGKKQPAVWQSILWIVFAVSILLFIWDINRSWTVWAALASGGILLLRWLTGPITIYKKQR